VRIPQVVASYNSQIGEAGTQIRRSAKCYFEAGDQVLILTHHVGGSPVDEWICGISTWGWQDFQSGQRNICVSDAERDMVMDSRDTMRLTASLEASLVVDRVQEGGVQLPSWADVVANTRELYSRATRAGRPAGRTRSI
jgi:hypothetical protein